MNSKHLRKQQQRLQRQQQGGTSFTAAFHSGPLPPPNILAEYDQVSPGLANTMVEMMTTETKHRRDMERGLLKAELIEVRSVANSKYLALTIAGAIVLVPIGLAAYLVILGQPIAGVVAFVLGCATLRWGKKLHS